jgi:hypothetical protein
MLCCTQARRCHPSLFSFHFAYCLLANSRIPYNNVLWLLSSMCIELFKGKKYLVKRQIAYRNCCQIWSNDLDPNRQSVTWEHWHAASIYFLSKGRPFSHRSQVFFFSVGEPGRARKDLIISNHSHVFFGIVEAREPRLLHRGTISIEKHASIPKSFCKSKHITEHTLKDMFAQARTLELSFTAITKFI